MANEQNLNPVKSKSEARERGRKGGIASGLARREKKTVKAILDEFMESDVTEYSQVEKIASKLGLERGKTIKDLFTIVCTLNTLKQGKVDDLLKVSQLLGEESETHNNGILDELANYLSGENNAKR